MNESLSNSNELPVGWITTLLSEISEINMGQSPPSETYNNIGNGLPFFQGKAEFSELHPVVEKWCSQPNKIAETNDILLSVRAPVGTTNIANQRCCIGRGLAAIRYTPNHKFLFYYLRLIEKRLDEKGTGTTFKAISGEILRNININVPPLPEQHSIVSKIEQLFSELDKGIESLKTAQQQLKVYRQSVLKWAFEGKLTEQWRQNQDLPDAQALLEKIQKDREEKAKASGKKPKPVSPPTNNELAALPELPKGWAWVRLGEIICDLTDYHANGSYEKLKEHVALKDEEDYAVMIRATNFEKNDFSNDLKYITKDAYNFLSKSKLYGHEILIGKIGNAGKVYLMRKLNRPASLAMNLFALRFDVNMNKYVYLHLTTSSSRNEIKSFVKGVGNPTIDKQAIRSLHIAFAPLPEQHQIVQEIESRLSECDNMEATITASLQQAEALRQSILKKAFEGRLLNEKELEAVRHDPTWEPAERLLERIRAEKAVLHSEKKGRKSKSGVK